MTKNYVNTYLEKTYLTLTQNINLVRAIYLWILPYILAIYTISLFTTIHPIIKDCIFIIILFFIFLELNSTYKIRGQKYLLFLFVSLLVIFPSALYNYTIDNYLILFYRKFQYFTMAFIPVFFMYKINIFRYWRIYTISLFLFFIFTMFFMHPDIIFKTKDIFLSRNSIATLALFCFLVLYKSIRNKLIFILFAIPLFYFMLKSGSKTAVYSIALLIFLHIAHRTIFNATLRNKIIYLFVFIVGFYYLYYELLFFSDITRLIENEVITSSNQRIVEMIIGLNVWYDNFIIGVGNSNFVLMIHNLFEQYAYMLFPNVPWYHLSGYDSTSQNVLIDLVAIYCLYSIAYILFLIYLLIIAFRSAGSLFFKYLLFIPVVILLVNSFSLGNGFEFIFYLFISFSLSINMRKNISNG